MLHVEFLYNEHNFGAALVVASLLALLALVTLVAKTLLEKRLHSQLINKGEEIEEDLPRVSRFAIFEEVRRFSS